MKSSPKSSPDKELVKVFEAAGVVDYLVQRNQTGRVLFKYVGKFTRMDCCRKRSVNLSTDQQLMNCTI